MAPKNQFDPHRDRQQPDPFFRPPNQYFEQLPGQIARKLNKNPQAGPAGVFTWWHKTGIAVTTLALALFWLFRPEIVEEQRLPSLTREDALAYLLHAEPDLEEMMEGFPAGADLLASTMSDISFEELEILAGELYELPWDDFPDNTFTD
jgi:hypothetical protein